MTVGESRVCQVTSKVEILTGIEYYLYKWLMCSIDKVGVFLLVVASEYWFVLVVLHQFVLCCVVFFTIKGV